MVTDGFDWWCTKPKCRFDEMDTEAIATAIRAQIARLDAAPSAQPEGARMLDLEQHLLRQMAFSHATYGPGARREGVIDHIRKELVEVEASGGSPSEWVDVVILALDGLTRAVVFGADGTRGDPAEAAGLVCRAILAKQAKNEARTWPDWRTAAPGKAIEHDRTGEGAALLAQTAPSETEGRGDA